MLFAVVVVHGTAAAVHGTAAAVVEDRVHVDGLGSFRPDCDSRRGFRCLYLGRRPFIAVPPLHVKCTQLLFTCRVVLLGDKHEVKGKRGGSRVPRVARVGEWKETDQ